ncbi:transcription termination/antitermination protein NusG [Puniceicoccus vermicola]|uniref:Transcription termination/antitermination protein NusG n=1 Tax=Puniceicoccus vermicola TaxID=388746 RepID=A0A7X1E7M4_9BACT|nr:transcription termination/antitermination NusG family protein [Puniceicoccus vermicola]MBC2603892.1 hypothetical protein [Puniceicoccus vermicola]
MNQDAEQSATAEDAEEFWYCLRSQTKKEHLAAAQIRHRIGIEVFAPRITFTKKTKRGKVRFTEALFPGYLFCYCHIETHLRHLLSMPGILAVVRYGNRIPPIPGEFIQELKDRIPAENFETPDPVIEVGAPVTVIDGPFKNLQAVVTQVLGARDRVRILLEFLGRQAEIEVASHSVFRDDHKPKEGF